MCFFISGFWIFVSISILIFDFQFLGFDFQVFFF